MVKQQISFDLENDGYQIIRTEATSISTEAKAAIEAAKRIQGTTSYRVSCSRAIAQELRAWFRHHEHGYLDAARAPALEEHAWKSPVCRRAADAIEAALQVGS